MVSSKQTFNSFNKIKPCYFQISTKRASTWCFYWNRQEIQKTCWRIAHFTFLKGNQASTWNRGEGWVRTVREVQIIDMLIIFFLMIVISTSLTVPTQPSPWFHVETCLPQPGTLKWTIKRFLWAWMFMNWFILEATYTEYFKKKI